MFRRSWDSQHRGWLWIHAASKTPEDDEIAKLEQHYLTTFAMSGLRPVFPKAYPVSVCYPCILYIASPDIMHLFIYLYNSARVPVRLNVRVIGEFVCELVWPGIDWVCLRLRSSFTRRFSQTQRAATPRLLFTLRLHDVRCAMAILSSIA